MAHADTTVDVQLACDDPDIPESDLIETWVAAAVAAAGVASESGFEVSVRIVGTEEIQELNAAYREQDKPTNVLSFPAAVDAFPPGQPALLGDIVVCAPVVRAEAAEQDKPLASHWGHMLVHGTLHLLGFDHEQDADAERMESLETRILATCGIANPYASR